MASTRTAKAAAKKSTRSTTATARRTRKKAGAKQEWRSEVEKWIKKIVGSPEAVEYAFAKGSHSRFWRFDYAWPSKKVAIEYEGLGYKSRHLTHMGYTKDCIKYSVAAINGWCVVRLTAAMFPHPEYGDRDPIRKQGIEVLKELREMMRKDE